MLVRGEGAVGLNADPPVPPPKGGASGREAVAARKKLWKERCCGREAVAAAWKELLLRSRTGEPGWPRIPPQGSRGAECETNPASGAEQAGKEGVTENPPSREEPAGRPPQPQKQLQWTRSCCQDRVGLPPAEARSTTTGRQGSTSPRSSLPPESSSMNQRRPCKRASKKHEIFELFSTKTTAILDFIHSSLPILCYILPL